MDYSINLVTQGEKREGSFWSDYIVVRGRRGHWLRWLTNPGGLGAFKQYSDIAWRAVWEGWWSGFDDWIQVSTETCPTCGHPTPLCSFCRNEARHFLDWNELVVSHYLCDNCVDRLVPDYERVLEEGVELGMYACCDACACDTWR